MHRRVGNEIEYDVIHKQQLSRGRALMSSPSNIPCYLETWGTCLPLPKWMCGRQSRRGSGRQLPSILTPHLSTIPSEHIPLHYAYAVFLGASAPLP